MAKITLRAYIQEIEKLIEDGQTDAALLHCEQILKVHPKHVDTHRLLGKVFLEKKNYPETELIFNKILSIFPDDFISHLGMSILSEGKNDLVSSVEHMERAFEIQPSNAAIQDELKRLYKVRDGVEPARIRLTRGALIKMYSRSNLYSQAIGEIRIALHEHPNSLDLEVELARMLFKAGQNIEAIERSIKILSQYPYCYEANRILSIGLPENTDIQDVSVYKHRLCELDPYIKFTTPEKPDVYLIPDIAISLDYLDISTLEKGKEINWINFIEEIWQDQSTVVTENLEEEVDWDEIIEKHFENESEKPAETQAIASKSELPVSEAQLEKAEKGNENLTELPETPQTISTDQKLQSDLQEEPEIISEWVDEERGDSEKLSENKSIEMQGEIPEAEKDMAGEQISTEVDKINEFNLHTTEETTTRESINEELEDIPDWLNESIQSKNEEKRQDINNTNHETLEETGYIDQDAPKVTNIFHDANIPPSIWIKDNEKESSKNGDNQHLEIKIEETKEEFESPSYYEVVLKDAHDALLSGDVHRSINSYKTLIEKNRLIDNVIIQLENDLTNFPELNQLWIILGDAYNRSGKPEKAIESYQRAEKHISSSDNHG